MSGRPRGTPQTPEVRKKIGDANRRHWQNPEYRAKRMPEILELLPRALAASLAVRPKLPPRGSREWHDYNKTRSILGVEGAHQAFNIGGNT